ncbi:outer membrane protein [Brucella pseudogrignonensis]|uniref:outer membrane protein n=1 Tax=Brucella pseudogrignonensis TaxID=419475 RepID=UPI003ED019DA
MKVIAPIAAAAVLLMPVASFAADAIQDYAPPAPVVEAVPFSWAGGYLGVSAGYMFDDTTRATASDLGGDQFSRRYIKGTDGFVGGIYGGYNFSSENFVYGLEANLDYADSKNSRNTFRGDATTHSDIGFNGALRARVGYSVDRALIYAAGGLAVADIEYKATDLSGTAKKSSTQAGYTIGGGVEYAVTDNVLLRTEYAFSDYGDKSVSTDLANYKFETKTHTLKVGLGYKF